MEDSACSHHACVWGSCRAGCLLGEAPEAHGLPRLLPASPRVGGGSRLVPHPPPCFLSEVSWGMVPGLGVAVAEPPGVGFGGDGGSAAPQRHSEALVAPSSPLGSAGGEAAFLHTPVVHRWVV